MSRSGVGLDFFQMEKETSSVRPRRANMLSGRRRSFRDLQSMVSKMNPELLKSVIASGSVEINSNVVVAKSGENGGALSAPKNSVSVPSTHESLLFPASPLPSVHGFGESTSGLESTTETSPLTIFYNGTVAVFDVPRNKAETIFRLAVSSNDQTRLLETIHGDLPKARRKSLQRFLEKRKERFTLASVYGCPVDYAFSGQN